jgi:hypothetical protein
MQFFTGGGHFSATLFPGRVNFFRFVDLLPVSD